MHPKGIQKLLWDLPSERLGQLLSRGLDANEPDDAGDYLLTVACHRLQLESVRLLLAAGADPNVRNADRDTPLICAIDCVAHAPQTALAIVEMLVACGAALEARGYMDKTPYLKACSRGNLLMVKKLVELGSDPRAVVVDGGTLTGLDFAYIFDASNEMKDFICGLQ